MKTSDALRKADELGYPIVRGKYIEQSVSKWHDEIPPTCAIGGAALVCGTKPTLSIGRNYVTNDGDFVTPASDDWTEVTQVPIFCPENCGEDPDYAHYMIPHLFDIHLWSRTQIADWLDNVLKDNSDATHI